MKNPSHVTLTLTLGRRSKLIPPPVVQGGGGVDGTPLGFHYVTIFRKVFTFSREPVTFLQDEVYIMGCGAGGL